jgi:polyisoprenoid-binding protein YceI
MTTATLAPTGTWNVDRVHSRVGFAVKHLGIATVRGSFNDFEGVFEFGEDLASSRAYGTVKTASVDTGESARDEHLRNADFFDAEINPDITFESTSIEHLDEDVLKVTGNLALNGVAKEQTFHAELQGTEVDPGGNVRVGLEISGQISRGDYGMSFGDQLLGSGNRAVGDKVKIAIDVSAIKAA